MSEEKRMVDAFEIVHSIHIWDREVLFGINKTDTETPYLVCNCTTDNPFGIQEFSDGVGGADYLELMGAFLNRVNTQLEAVKAERTLSPFHWN